MPVPPLDDPTASPPPHAGTAVRTTTCSAGTPRRFAAAFVVQCTGSMAARGVFLAQAEHPQKLYDEALS